MAIVWIDGEWRSREDARISVYDHGLLYGDGLFEGLRWYSGRIFRLDAHLDRLWDGARAIALSLPYTRDEMAATLREGVERAAKPDGYIRLVVTRGVGDLGISPALCPRPTVLSIFDDIRLYPRECYERGIAVVTASSRRLQGDVFDPRIKSLNYLNNVLAKLEAQVAGCMEAVFLNREGYVTECTGDNVFIVKNGVLKTPAVWLGLLEGITRNSILEIARGSFKRVEETTMTKFDLYTADECFLTGSGAEVIPVTKIDGRAIGTGEPGPMTEGLRAEFARAVRQG